MKNFIIFCLATCLLAACQKPVQKADAYGNFEAEEQIVSAEASGIILQLNVEEGQNLEAGQIVGAIDSIQLTLRKQQLQASIKAVASKSPKVAAQLAVFTRQSDAISQQISTLEREKRRVENLLKSDAATPKQLDDLNAQIEAANKQMQVVLEQQAASNAVLSTQKDGILAEILPLQKQVEQLVDQLSRCRIRNPVAGTVLTSYAAVGELAGTGKPLYKIADLSTLVFRAYLAGDQLGQVKLGQKVQILIDGPDGSQQGVEGKVTWISPKAEFTPKVIQTKAERVNLVYALKVAVPNPAGALKIGMPGELRLTAPIAGSN
jgi:HlyD family secretion protein